MDESRIVELLDREAIRDCLFRYCRGIDRADEETLRGAYWPDATDQHGPYSGSAEGFIDFAVEVFKTGPRNIHQISNILIEFSDESNAVVESYFNALQRSTGADGKEQQVLLCGRYCDSFQKRDGEWRIAERLVVYDWVEEQTPPSTSEEERFAVRKPIGASWPDDPIYGLLAKSRDSAG